MRLLAPEKPKAPTGDVSAAAKEFDPFHPAYVLDPYPIMAAMQKSEPVFYSPTIDTYVVLRHATVGAVLRDPKRFSAGIVSDPLTPLCPEARSIIANSEFDVPGLLVNNDTQRHPHCRKFFGEPLRPQRLKTLQPFIEQTVDSYIDAMLEQGSHSDLASALTWDVPALVLFKLLGIPQADIPRVKAYADSRVVLLWGRPTAADQIRLSTGAVEFFRYTTRLVHDRMANPRDDYPSDLLRQRDGDDEKATIRDIIAVTFNLLFAGHETTSSAAANTLHAVLSRQPIWKCIVEGSMDIPKVVEEGLRYDPPVQAWRRQAKEDVTLEGVHIPAGSHILLVFAAANRDPERFVKPDEFDPSRPDATQHITFGMGAHFCLGAPLARIEIGTMIERLAKRIPKLSIAPDNVLSYLPNTSFRGLRRLQVVW
jgi:cytochrome P450